MRADGAIALAVTAFGLSFIAGMQIGGESPPPASGAPSVPPATVEHIALADTQALPDLAAARTPRAVTQPRPKPKPKPKAKQKPKPKPKSTVRTVIRRPAPVVAAAPTQQVVAPAPRPVVAPPAPRPVSTPRPVRTPTATATPAPTFDDHGQSNEFNDGGGP